LSSNNNWDKTHKPEEKLFKVVGATALFGIIFPRYVMFIALVPVISTVSCLVIYSCLSHQKRKK